MEIEVITSCRPEGDCEDGQPAEGIGAEEHRPLSCEALGGSIVENRPLETIEETPNVKAKPKRSARPKAVRFEALGSEANAVSERRASSTPAEPKVKAKSRSKASTRPTPEEREAVEVAAEPKESVLEPLSEEAHSGAALEKNGPGRGRPPGARNKPKPPQIVERVVEKMVYEKPPPLSPQDLQALLKDTLRKQELDAREQKRAYYSQLIRRNR